jgi:hypothetical protein
MNSVPEILWKPTHARVARELVDFLDAYEEEIEDLILTHLSHRPDARKDWRDLVKMARARGLADVPKMLVLARTERTTAGSARGRG